MKTFLSRICALSISASFVALPGTALGVALPADAYIAPHSEGVGPVDGNTGLVVTIGQGQDGEPVAPLIFDHLELTPANSGQIFTKTATDPAFADFAALLTNGIPDLFTIQVFTNHVAGGGDTTRTEQEWFTSSTGAPFPFATDFHGLKVKSISLVVNRVFIAGGYVNIDADWAVQVTPEPPTLILAALGGLALLAWRCRR